MRYYNDFHLACCRFWTLHLIPSFQVSLCWFDTLSFRRKYVAKSTFDWRRLTRCIKELIEMDGDVQKQTGEETNNHDGDSDGDSSEADSEGVILQNLHVTKSNALTCWCTCRWRASQGFREGLLWTNGYKRRWRPPANLMLTLSRMTRKLTQR